MNKRLISILIANLFVAAPALAQDFKVEGSVSLGGIYVDDKDAKDASKLNEYQDLSNGLVSGVSLSGRGGRYWFDLFGENFGRDDQYISLKGGSYDLFKYRLYSDALKHNFLFGGRTPYAGAGSGANTASGWPLLNSATWNSVDVAYKRRDDGGMFEFQGLSPWYFRVDGNQVTTSGTKIGAASQGTSPSNGYVDLAFPTEYKTKNAMVEGGYSAKNMHFALQWMTSKFDNDQETVTWNNGYFGNGVDTTYLAPDNKYQRLAANATFRKLPLNSTLALRFTKDELESNAALGTQVLNTTTGGFAATPANVSTYNGKVDNETYTFALASTPMKNLDTRVYYNHYKREDKSTDVLYGGTIGPFENELFSYKKKNFGVDGYYRLNRTNRLGAGYDDLDTERTRFDFDSTKDKKWFVEWKNSDLDIVSMRLKYTALQRESNFLLANDGANANDVLYWNRFLKAYDAANLDQDVWKLTLDSSPAEFVDLSLEATSRKNKYKDMVLGRLKDDKTELYASASFGDPSKMRFTVFGDVEKVKYESRHRVVGSATAPGAYDPATPDTATNYNWQGSNTDKNWAFGIAADMPATEKLMLKASIMYYKTDGSLDFATGSPLSAATYPQNVANYDDAKRTSFSLRGVYAFSKTLSMTAGYAYEKYDYKDAAYDGYQYTIPAATRQDSYLLGYYANPQYKANILFGFLTYKF